MNFNSFFLKSFRVLLLPFALLYGAVIIIRNWLYNQEKFRSANFSFPLICVGNLVVGGTGKSPMVEYLVELLQPHFNIATLSRGYKRKTKGYALAKENTTAIEIGDEPMQFHLKYPDLPVAVGEERIVAIPQLLHDRPQTQAIILDDAFQHREIAAGFNILLTQYGDLYTSDFFMPTGDLRDQRSSAKRAQMIVVTKCPPDLSVEEKNKIRKELHPHQFQEVFFTAIEYGKPYHIITKELKAITQEEEVLLVCGIANPRPLKQYLSEQAATYYQIDYSDHHIFRIDDLKEIKKRFTAITATQKMIVTTEKDAVRLIKFSEELAEMPIYALPIQHRFLFDEAHLFNKGVIDFISDFKGPQVIVQSPFNEEQSA
ncbi:tetraacyldisaccharide 4'-kinase [Limnovirga soli]|uniref:Tetraacyldisaccharide 4'-kinase n=1 Tax=Limnovirga soli TaxID=2656915 RepID=A0A8J8JVN4_9BACT|nr:tetraacyldisaccharide 4'-kinase [Limnovirga soli]NNV54441.1 tetraacyldisaccharide 4'-kinase [Limnovirga soli]